MALFSKPPAKKPDVAKPAVKPAANPARPPPSARDAVQAQGRRGMPERARAEPSAEISLAGASLIEWSPVRTSIEVAQSNPGLCAVLENAALLFASGQALPARTLLAEGVATDPEAKESPLAWLALFDLLQRANDRAGFDRLALQYVVQFERSAPPWDEEPSPSRPQAQEPKVVAGYVALTGKLTAASAHQIETLRKTMAKSPANSRLDLAQVAGFDDAGASLLAAALAEARKMRWAVSLQKPEKMRAALDILVRRGRAAGEGAWLLSLEFLQCEQKQEAFEDRAIEYAVAFEQSPPSWDPPPVPAVDAPHEEHPHAEDTGGVVPSGAEAVHWTGVLTGAATRQMAQLAEFAHAHAVVVIDMTDVERVDFVCAGALLNAIARVEAQRKAVQIFGASPIIRALLLLIGISPRHFVKKAQ
jgi:anti-anti-sigma regulatory factor